MNNDNRTNNPTGGKISGAAKVVHGAGDNIRGTFLGAIDTMTHSGQTKHDDIAQKGRLEMEEGLAALRGNGKATTGPATANTGLGTGHASSEPQNGYPSHHRDDAITGLPPKQLEEVRTSGQSGQGVGQPGGYLDNDKGFASHTSYGNTSSGPDPSFGKGQTEGMGGRSVSQSVQGSYGNENSTADTFDNGAGGQGMNQTGRGANVGSGRGVDLGSQGMGSYGNENSATDTFDNGTGGQGINQTGRGANVGSGRGVDLGSQGMVTSQGSYGNENYAADSFDNGTGERRVDQTGRGANIGSGRGVGHSIQSVDQPDRYQNNDGVTPQGSYGGANSAADTFGNGTGGQAVGQTSRDVNVESGRGDGRGNQGVGRSFQGVDQPDRYNNDGVTSQGSYGNENSAENASFDSSRRGQGVGQTGRGVGEVGGQGIDVGSQGPTQSDRYHNNDKLASQRFSGNETSAFGSSTAGQGVGQTDRGADLGSHTNNGYSLPSEFEASAKTLAGYDENQGQTGSEHGQMGSRPNNYQDNTIYENIGGNMGEQGGIHPGGRSNV